MPLAPLSDGVQDIKTGATFVGLNTRAFLGASSAKKIAPGFQCVSGKAKISWVKFVGMGN